MQKWTIKTPLAASDKGFLATVMHISISHAGSKRCDGWHSTEQGEGMGQPQHLQPQIHLCISSFLTSTCILTANSKLPTSCRGYGGPAVPTCSPTQQLLLTWRIGGHALKQSSSTLQHALCQALVVGHVLPELLGGEGEHCLAACWAAPTPAWPCAPGHTHQVTAQRCPHAGSIRHGGHPAVRRVRHVIQPTDELLQLVAKHLHNKSQLLLRQLPALLLTATQTRGVHLQLLLPEGSSGSIEHLHLFLKASQ